MSDIPTYAEITEQFVNKIKVHKTYKQIDDYTRHLFVEKIFKVGSIYTVDKFNLALGGNFSNHFTLYKYGKFGKSENFEIDEDANFLYLGVEKNEHTKENYCVVFLYDNNKYCINISEALNFIKEVC